MSLTHTQFDFYDLHQNLLPISDRYISPPNSVPVINDLRDRKVAYVGSHNILTQELVSFFPVSQ